MSLKEDIADYTQEIQSNPDDAKSYFYRGLAHSDSGKFDKALKDLKKS